MNNLPASIRFGRQTIVRINYSRGVKMYRGCHSWTTKEFDISFK